MLSARVRGFVCQLVCQSWDELDCRRMPIAGPQSAWARFRKTTAVYDLWSGAIGAGGLLVSAARFFTTGNSGWGWFVVVLAVVVLIVQGFKARATYGQQAQKESVHELQGCLQTLETVLLGPDLEPAKRQRAGLRLTVHIPDGNSLVQAMDYVGDQRTPKGAGRRLPENMGVIGQAYQQAKLTGSIEIHCEYRASEDYDAFLSQMVRDYAFTLEAAQKLHAGTKSWLAVPILNAGTVEGVVYCDSKLPDFFTDARQEDVLHAMAGIAYFVGLRYS